MSTGAVIMMVLMLGIYFGGFIYFSLRKEPKKRGSAENKPGN
ncbi:MAG TPA: methionine/alanine import family NSS transporter small subunit [Candidatus Saccharicenans sp.]|jgi:preprotein translocase subunit YajC|nr:methionine/alanine import family NSS transporter small subunit [Candidatus Saccharicenans sp.]HNT00996.1 methionine/alanine import family NSS transporter small subunit [Candidatus Saccharicenans sp.]